jgi:hypothetical protein
MSYDQNQNEAENTIPMVITIVSIVVIALVAALSEKVADALGADLWVLRHALVRMAIGFLVFVGIVIGAAYRRMFYNLKWTVGLLVAVTGSVVWWCFGTVLDSMALGGQNPASEMVFHFDGYPWWDSWWFQWGGTGLLLVFVVVAWVCARKP